MVKQLHHDWHDWHDWCGATSRLVRGYFFFEKTSNIFTKATNTTIVNFSDFYLWEKNASLTQSTSQRYGKLSKEVKDGELVALNPNGWMRCFGISDEKEIKLHNEDIKYKLKEKEREYREERAKKGRSVMGAKKLRSQNLDLSYIPNRSGKKMWVLCDDIKLRKWVIYQIKQLVKKAKEVYEKWKLGDYSEPYPLGLYPPGMPKLAEPIVLFD